MTKNIYTTYRLRLKINEKWFAWLFKSSGKESYYAFPKFNLKTVGLLGSLYRDVVLNGRTFKSQFFVVHGWISLPQTLLLQFDSFHFVSQYHAWRAIKTLASDFSDAFLIVLFYSRGTWQKHLTEKLCTSIVYNVGCRLKVKAAGYCLGQIRQKFPSVIN